MDEDLKEFLLIAGVVIVIMVVLFTILASLIFTLEWYSCKKLSEHTSLPTQFVYFGGGADNCIINANGQLLPTDKWRVNTGN